MWGRRGRSSRRVCYSSSPATSAGAGPGKRVPMRSGRAATVRATGHSASTARSTRASGPRTASSGTCRLEAAPRQGPARAARAGHACAARPVGIRRGGARELGVRRAAAARLGRGRDQAAMVRRRSGDRGRRSRLPRRGAAARRRRAGLAGGTADAGEGAGIYGTAGNGYALLAAFERTGDEEWLDRARRFAAHALGQVERGEALLALDRDAGVAVFVADCLEARRATPFSAESRSDARSPASRPRSAARLRGACDRPPRAATRHDAQRSPSGSRRIPVMRPSTTHPGPDRRPRRRRADRGPDDLGRDPSSPRRRLELAALDLPDMDAQAVLGPVSAREALGERIALEMDVTQRGSLRLGHGDRGRRPRASSGSSLGHERLPVQEQQALLLRGHRQRPVERRGSRSVTSAGPSMCAASRPEA